MSWVQDFRRFIMRGSVVDLAIGVVIGTSFTAIVNSLVDDIIMPFIAGLMGGSDFSDLSFQFRSATITYGNFIQAIINFLIIALVQWWATWYPGGEPGGGGFVVQRMASCKDERNSLLATLWFQLAHYCLRPWPWKGLTR